MIIEYHATKAEANKAYRQWVMSHRAQVARCWQTLKVCLPNAPFVMNPETERKVELLVQEHDLSKLSTREFYGYRQWYHPVLGEKPNIKKFERACRLHRRKNPHHNSYWRHHTYIHERDHIYLVEMVLDWWALSEVTDRNPRDHYLKVKKNLALPREAINMLEYLLLVINKIIYQRRINVT